jgi:hypothetical protein
MHAEYTEQTVTEPTVKVGFIERTKKTVVSLMSRIAGKESEDIKNRCAAELYEQKCRYDALELERDRATAFTGLKARETEELKARLDFVKREVVMWRERADKWAANCCTERDRVERYRKAYQSACRSVSALRGHITKMKKKVAAQSAPNVSDGR